MAQVSEADLLRAASDGDNSIAVICAHIAGNLKSRFTDFLTTDGEKPWRQRDEEFEARRMSRAEIVADWNAGWTVLMASLESLSDADLQNTVTIRRQPLLVHEALHRSLAHTAYHVGQIVYLAKSMRGDGFRSLSIPRGQSDAYNRNPAAERGAARGENPAGRRDDK